MSRRLAWLCNKIDAKRGPQGALAREARSLAWMLGEVVDKNGDAVSTGAMAEYAEAIVRYNALLHAWSDGRRSPLPLEPPDR